MDICDVSAALVSDSPGLVEYLRDINWKHIMTYLVGKFAASRPHGKQDVVEVLGYSARGMRSVYPPMVKSVPIIDVQEGLTDVRMEELVAVSEIEGGLLGRQWLATHDSEARTRVRVEALDSELGKVLRDHPPAKLCGCVRQWMESLPRATKHVQNWVGAVTDGPQVRLVSTEPVGAAMRSVSHQIQESLGKRERLPLKRVSAWIQGACAGAVEVANAGLLGGLSVATDAVLADTGPNVLSVRLRDPGLRAFFLDRAADRTEADVVRQLGDLLASILDYRYAVGELDSGAVRRRAEVDNAPVELRSLAQTLQSADAPPLQDIPSKVGAVCDGLLRSVPPGVDAQIPFPADGLSFQQWSVPDSTRMHLTSMASNARQVVDMTVAGAEELVHFAHAVEVSDDVRTVVMKGPEPGQRGTVCSTVSELRRLRGASISGNPVDRQKAVAADVGTRTTSAEAPMTNPATRLRHLQRLHDALFVPKPFQVMKDHTLLSYVPREMPEGASGPVFTEFLGVPGPRAMAFYDQFGIEHADTGQHLRQQRVLWAEFVKALGYVPAETVEAPPPQAGAAPWAVDIAVWNAVARALMANKSLRILHIKNCLLSGAALEVLCAAAIKGRQLEEVALENCGVSSAVHVNGIAAVLGSDFLRRLVVTGGRLPAPVAAPLLAAAAGSSTLEELSLDDCCLAKESAADLARVVAGAPRLRVLRLRNNDLREEGAHLLAENMARFPCKPRQLPAQELDLSGNGVTMAGCVAVISALQRDSPMEWGFEGCLLATRQHSASA